MKQTTIHPALWALFAAFTLVAPALAAPKPSAEEAARARELAQKVMAERREANDKRRNLFAEVKAALKTNGLERARALSDEALALAAFVASDGKTRPVDEADLLGDLIGVFAERKLWAASVTTNLFERRLALLRPATPTNAPSVAYLKAEFAYAAYLYRNGLAPDEEALGRVERVLLAEGIPALERTRLLLARANLRDRIDYEDFLALAFEAAGDDILALGECYAASITPPRHNEPGRNDAIAAFPANVAKLLADPRMTPYFFSNVTDRAFRPLDDYFRLKIRPAYEQCGRRADMVAYLEKCAAGKRPAEELAKIRAMLADAYWDLSARDLVGRDPVLLEKAYAASRALLPSIQGRDADSRRSDTYLAMARYDFHARRYDRMEKTVAEMEAACATNAAVWRPFIAAWRGRVAYEREDFEAAYALFKSIDDAAYAAEQGERKRQTLVPIYIEQYVRTCCALGKYDEAYALRDPCINYTIPNWYTWQRDRLKRYFENLKRRCENPEQ